MTDFILKAANLYAEGLKKVEERRAQWLQKYAELKEHLTKVAEALNENAGYKQGFYIDSLHAFDEGIKGTCAEMPSLAFRSGDMPMLVNFCNDNGENSRYMEKGFEVAFTPSITGQLVVLLMPHHSGLNKNPAKYITLGFFDFPAVLTMDMTDQIIAKAIETAYYTSFTGIGQQASDMAQQEAPPMHEHNPIGFRRYETTEKSN